MERTRKRPAETQEAAWIADEDRFVLQQAKKKAAIRVKEGRAKPVDWLAVTLRFTDPSRNIFDDEVTDADLDIVDPEGVLEGLDADQLLELSKDIDVYASLETNKANLDFWQTMAVICKERRQKLDPTSSKSRSQNSVSSEVDRLFSSKTYAELEKLEGQIKTKLRSDEPIDFEYWEGLLESLISWKARAKLRSVSQSIVENQLKGLRQQQQEEATNLKTKISNAMLTSRVNTVGASKAISQKDISHAASLDPEPLLKTHPEDQRLEVHDETTFLKNIASDRRRILKLGYVPLKQVQTAAGSSQTQKPVASKNISGSNEEFSRATIALYEREVARGVSENEEIFASEEQVSTASKPQWAGKYRPRKPRYFNRVQMGYEWNKYNQTHYDHDNPPPKVVQGYKFNIFYPDLIDRTRAPTYKIEREHGRKRGQSFAPAGEEDTCLIRFIAGPPYEDVAFRIVDKEWDYSAKRERGFKSSFDKGILQLHFQFKKIFYRK